MMPEHALVLGVSSVSICHEKLSLPQNVKTYFFVCVSATSADALPGVLRWQSRLWQLVTKLRGARQLGEVPNPSLLKKKELAETKKIWENMNFAIQEVATP